MRVTTRMRTGSIVFALVCLFILGVVLACDPGEDTPPEGGTPVVVDIDRSKPRPTLKPVKPAPAKPAPARPAVPRRK